MKTTKTEPEDFEKITEFESGEFAIVDASLIRSLEAPGMENVVYIATKQSREKPQKFKIKASYSDATLENLTIEPENESEEIVETQLSGKDGNPVQKKLSKINRINGEFRPNTASRSERNKRYSAKGDPKTLLSKNDRIKSRMAQRMSLDRARSDNYGQPQGKEGKNEVETECLELIKTLNSDSIPTLYLESIKNFDKIHQLLSEVRRNNLVKGNNYDLVNKSIEIMENFKKEKSQKWAHEIAQTGRINVRR